MTDDQRLTTLKPPLHADLNAAMRQRDQVRTGTLRMALTAVTNEEVVGDLGARALRRRGAQGGRQGGQEASRRPPTAYTDAGRPELAEKEVAELGVLEGYLPAQLSDEELEALVAQAVSDDRGDRHGVRWAWS